MATYTDLLTLWMWPAQAARIVADTADTMSGAGRVVAARLPTLAAAARDPWTADGAELARMVTEKASAFDRSGRAGSAALRRGEVAVRANLAATARLMRGEMLWPGEWLKLATDNLAAAAMLAALPAAALVPIHDQVMANDRRLGRRKSAPSAGSS